tara:strand:- start:2456 stop:2863 length:408 start_codon:yes stop_codon:yes gene_type:complete
MVTAALGPILIGAGDIIAGSTLSNPTILGQTVRAIADDISLEDFVVQFHTTEALGKDFFDYVEIVDDVTGEKSLYGTVSANYLHSNDDYSAWTWYGRCAGLKVGGSYTANFTSDDSFTPRTPNAMEAPLFTYTSA